MNRSEEGKIFDGKVEKILLGLLDSFNVGFGDCLWIDKFSEGVSTTEGMSVRSLLEEMLGF